jgi:hypothetical protein
MKENKRLMKKTKENKIKNKNLKGRRWKKIKGQMKKMKGVETWKLKGRRSERK